MREQTKFYAEELFHLAKCKRQDDFKVHFQNFEESLKNFQIECLVWNFQLYMFKYQSAAALFRV